MALVSLTDCSYIRSLHRDVQKQGWNDIIVFFYEEVRKTRKKLDIEKSLSARLNNEAKSFEIDARKTCEQLLFLQDSIILRLEYGNQKPNSEVILSDEYGEEEEKRVVSLKGEQNSIDLVVGENASEHASDFSSSETNGMDQIPTNRVRVEMDMSLHEEGKKNSDNPSLMGKMSLMDSEYYNESVYNVDHSYKGDGSSDKRQ